MDNISNPNPLTIKSRDCVKCKLCIKIIKNAYNLKRHLLDSHVNFINLRVKEEGISIPNALQLTYDNHVVKGDFIPQVLIDLFNIKKTKVTHFFKRSLPDNSNTPSETSNEIINLDVAAPVVESPSEKSPLPPTNITGEVAEECRDVLENTSLVLPEYHNKSVKRKHRDDTILSMSDSDLNKGSKDDQNASRLDNARTGIEQIVPPEKFIKLKQLKFGPCVACSQIKSRYKHFINDLTLLLKSLAESYDGIVAESCKCIELSDCCCMKTKETVKVEFDVNTGTINVADVCTSQTQEGNNKDCASNINVQEFFFRNEVSGRYFCTICLKHSPSKKAKCSNDWSVKGYSFEGGNRQSVKLLYMRRHLDSAEHKKALLQKNLGDKISQPVRYSVHVSRIVTENLCETAKYFCEHNLSQRAFPNYCALIDNMSRPIIEDREKFIHLLGNRSHSKNALGFAKKACHEAILQKISVLFHSQSVVTRSSKKLMVSADKGTKAGDKQRQVLVGTYITDAGILEEFTITAAAVAASNGVAAADHFSKHLKKITNPDNIVAISTDGDGSYVGSENGMISILKKRRNINQSVVYLPDFCHKAERLVGKCVNLSPWVKETLESSEYVVLSLGRSKLSRKLIEFSFNSDGQFHFFPPQKISDTRWAEYGHIHIRSVLYNVDICLKCLPGIIELSDACDIQVVDSARQILQKITSPYFIARLLLIDSVFYTFSLAEKEAQHSAFGPFEYLRLVKRLKESLESIKTYDFGSIKAVLSGVYEYEFRYNRHTYIHSNNLQEVYLALALNLRSGSDRTDSFEHLKEQYLILINSLIDNYDEFLKIDPEIQLAYDIFGSIFTPKFFDTYLIKFRMLFSLLNIDFYPCTPECSGINLCACAEGQLNRFLSHRSKFPENNLNFYISIDNSDVVNKLQIVNILRVIEVVLLLKASQSGTERVVSVISNIVEHNFKGKYKYIRKEDDDDLVNVTVCVKQNEKIFDRELAYEKFIKAGHFECLMKTKPRFIKSKVTKSIYAKQFACDPRKRTWDLSVCLDSVRSVSQGVSEVQPDPQDNDGLELECAEVVDVDMNPPLITSADGPNLEISGALSEVHARLPGKQKKKDVYCICGDNEKYENFIGCENNNECLSYLKRWKELRVNGGDWFHNCCIGLPDVVDDNLSWSCYPCYLDSLGIKRKFSNPRQLLELDLAWENWIITSINPDGNCMFSVFASHMYGDSSLHIDARKIIMDKLHAIFCLPKYRGDWSTRRNCPSKDSKDVVDKFVYKIIHYYSDLILGEGNDGIITLDARTSYISKKYDAALPGDSHKRILEKYGCAIEMEVFCLIVEKNIFTMQPEYINNSLVSFKWGLQMIYNCPVNDEAVSEDLKNQDYVCFYYELKGSTDGAHYSSMEIKVRDCPTIRPMTDKRYPLDKF